jgi:uncharacterized membrane protein YdbT with pleckstrin-like domain
MRTKLRESETIVMVTKRHPVTIIWLYAATVALLALRVWLPTTSLRSVGPYVWYIIIAVVLISIVKTWSRERDIWVVTDQRVVDEAGIFTIRSMECPLDKITNVMIAQSVPGRILGYGKIQIQTAGEAGLNEVVKVMRPRLFRNAIFEQQERSRERMMQRRVEMEAQQPADEEDMKECPFCAEKIRAKAVICRFCNRELPPKQ